MANRLDNVRLVSFLANGDNNHNHLKDHKRPMLNNMLQIPADAEPVTLEPGQTYYLPGTWCNETVDYKKKKFLITVPNNAKALFAGGVKTK